MTYDQIAAELGYANRGTVYHVVSEALKAQTAEAVGELRSLEVERLDNLQLAVWQKAMDGDVPSASAVVRVIMARCRLLGLDGPSLLNEAQRSRTLVVPPVDVPPVT
jgi:cyanate lyase